jgi:hypothetical protein
MGLGWSTSAGPTSHAVSSGGLWSSLSFKVWGMMTIRAGGSCEVLLNPVCSCNILTFPAIPCTNLILICFCVQGL